MDGRWKPENPEETHTQGEYVQLHIDSNPSSGPWHCGMAMIPTALLGLLGLYSGNVLVVLFVIVIMGGPFPIKSVSASHPRFPREAV